MFNIFTPVELIIKLENLVYKIVSWTHWYNYQLFVCTLIIRCFFWKNNYPLTSPEVRSFVLGNSEIKYWSSYSCRSRIHLVSLKYVGSLAQRITVKWRDQALILKIKSNHIQGRARGGIHGGGSFNITSACISLPQVRHSGVSRGAVVLLPPLGVPKIQN